MRQEIVALVVALSVSAPGSLRAQTPAWDVPGLAAPGPRDDLGLYFVKPRDTAWGFAASWHRAGSLDLGVRGEYVRLGSDGGPDAQCAGAGVEISGRMVPAGPVLAVDWTAGAGFLAGGGSRALRLPVGVSVGLRLGNRALHFLPYLHPRVALAFSRFRPGREGSGASALQLDTDAGLDVVLTPSLVLRIGGSFGDGPALGAGAALRLRRH